MLAESFDWKLSSLLESWKLLLEDSFSSLSSEEEETNEASSSEIYSTLAFFDSDDKSYLFEDSKTTSAFFNIELYLRNIKVALLISSFLKEDVLRFLIIKSGLFDFLS